MSKTAIISPELTPPVGPFSQAIEVGGSLYFSGQVGQYAFEISDVRGDYLSDCDFRRFADTKRQWR